MFETPHPHLSDIKDKWGYSWQMLKPSKTRCATDKIKVLFWKLKNKNYNLNFVFLVTTVLTQYTQNYRKQSTSSVRECEPVTASNMKRTKIARQRSRKPFTSKVRDCVQQIAGNKDQGTSPYHLQYKGWVLVPEQYRNVSHQTIPAIDPYCTQS